MVCPICTVAVGASLGILRAFGVDDIITGLWFGALIVSSIAWMINWMNKKKIHFVFRKIVIIMLFYILFIGPLYWFGYMKSAPELYGYSRLMIGVVIGSIIFILGVFADKYLRKINEDKQIVIFQKVIIPLIFLIVASVILYFTIKIIGVV
jgi:hypothetical protein